jgi:hypothetical protein
MNHLREAAQQALESLEKTHTQPGCEQWQAERKASVVVRAALSQEEPNLRNANLIGLTPLQKALQQAQFRADSLAQQEQEPVAPYAWMAVGGTIWRRKTSEDDVPLYTAPPRRKWQSLSEEEIHDCFQQRHKDKATERRMIALAIEQALRSKNK